MMRLHRRVVRRRLATVALAAALALPMSFFGRALAQPAPTPPPTTPPAGQPAPAQPAPADAGAPAPATPAPEGAAPDANAAKPQAPADLKTAVENYWHYGKVARYDLANVEGNPILASGPQPVQGLETFEQVAEQRKDNLEQRLP